MNMHLVGLGYPKGERRSTKKSRKSRRSSKVVKSVRHQCVDRDGYCRLAPGHPLSDEAAPVLKRPCSGFSEWAHYGRQKRARTRGQAPELRHTTAGSFMACQFHHASYDSGKLWIIADAKRGCDGRIVFGWRS